MATLICPHCGMANRAGSNFCNNCGTDLRAEEIPLPANVEGADFEAADASDRDGGTGEETAWLDEQPWLRDEEDAEAPPAAAQSATGRLITGLQGLLPPLNLSSYPDAAGRPATVTTLTPAEVQEVQRLMAGQPAPVAEAIALPAPHGRPSLRIPWIFWLLGLAALLPLMLAISEPLGAPRSLPGVQEAYLAVESLPRNSTVFVYWGYDPATAGELDQAARPVVRHLLTQEANLAVVSLLPGGPATARRLTAEALFDDAGPAGMTDLGLDRLQIAEQTLLQNTFLTGGVAALPLLGHAPIRGLSGSADDLSASRRALLEQPPALAVVIAAQAEDVQYWLEQVQPVNGVPVIAVTGAGADPVLRPYVDSGQLRGLVSGFDGGDRYDQLTGRPRQAEETGQWRVRLAAQNWGQLALLAIILLGNVAGLLGRRSAR